MGFHDFVLTRFLIGCVAQNRQMRFICKGKSEMSDIAERIIKCALTLIATSNIENFNIVVGAKLQKF